MTNFLNTTVTPIALMAANKVAAQFGTRFVHPPSSHPKCYTAKTSRPYALAKALKEAAISGATLVIDQAFCCVDLEVA